MGTVIAIISGALMSMQGVFNSKVTEKAGIWTTNTFVQFSAFVVCFVMWLIRERTNLGAVLQVQPKYLLLGGVMGAFITWTVICSMAKMGPAGAVLVIVVAQIIVAYLIEMLGMFGVEKEPFAWHKLIGAVIAIAGLVVFQKS